MRKFLLLLLSVIFVFAFSACGNDGDDKDNGNNDPDGGDEKLGITFDERDMKEDGQLYTEGVVKYPNSLWEKPQVEYDSALDSGSVKAIFISSPIKYNAKPTKIMGYIGFPEDASESNKCPAIVLVHGGLGTAYPDWVKMWNDRGYAAIAIDTEGGQSSASTNMNTGEHAERNKYHNDATWTAGPSNNSTTNPGGDGFWMPGGVENIQNSWMYHATSAVILSNSLLRSDERVDAGKVGITGISWGSIITNIVVGYDDRYAFAMPVYGSVAIDGTAGWLSSYPSEESRLAWDTIEPMKLSKAPIMWLTGNHDEAFGLDGPSACYLASQNGFLSIKTSLAHGQTYGAEPGELLAFSEAVLGNGNQIIKVTKNPTKAAPELQFKIGTEVSVNNVKLYYTTDKAYKPKSVWKTMEIAVDENNFAAINYPANATYCYVNITYNNNLNVATPLAKLN